jgi:hypothetical protein
VLTVVFNYKETDNYTEKMLIGSLLRQLIQFSPDRSRLDLIGKPFDFHSPLATRPNVEELSTVLKQTLNLFPRSYIIVDAVDENPKAAQSFLRNINCLNSSTSIFATSRHPPIESFKSRDQIIIDSDDSDMRTYVDSCITHDVLLNGLEINFRQEIIRVVMARSDKM